MLDEEMKRSKIGGLAATGMLLWIFPGFFVYHYLGAIFGFPLILGNAWSLSGIVGAAILLPFGYRAAFQPGSRPWAFGVVSLVVIVLVYALVYRLWGDPWQSSDIPLRESIKLAAGLMFFFSAGYLMAGHAPKPGVWMAALAILVLLSLMEADYDAMVLDFSVLPDAPYEAANYQALARSVVPVALFCLALVPSRRLQALTLTATLLTLYVIGARSEFYGMVAIAAAWVVICVLKHEIRYALLGLIWMAICSASLYGATNLDRFFPTKDAGYDQSVATTLPTQERQLEALNLAESASWQERALLLKEGLQAIAESPIFGDYAGQMRERDFGAYIHNGLSAWHQYGIVAFIIYSGLSLAAAAICCWRLLIKRDFSAMWVLAFYLACYSLLLVIAVKAVFWTIPALAWGLTAGLMSRDRIDVPTPALAVRIRETESASTAQPHGV